MQVSDLGSHLAGEGDLSWPSFTLPLLVLINAPWAVIYGKNSVDTSYGQGIPLNSWFEKDRYSELFWSAHY